MSGTTKTLTVGNNKLVVNNEGVSINNSKSGGPGIAILLIVGIMLFIGFCINSSKPKCVMGGCGKERTSGSQYCVLHDLSYRSYGNPDYNAVYKQSQEKKKQDE